MFTHKYEYTIKWIASPAARNDAGNVCYIIVRLAMTDVAACYVIARSAATRQSIKKDALFPGRLYIISLIQLISLQLAF